jgi:hypothetical protein
MSHSAHRSGQSSSLRNVCGSPYYTVYGPEEKLNALLVIGMEPRRAESKWGLSC